MLISVEGLKVEFGTKPLFTEASFVVNQHDRISLVGKNGAGKSTLLKILCRQQMPTAGSVNANNGATIGYLPQVMILQDDTTLRDEVRKAFSDVTRQQQLVSSLEKQMSEREDYESEEYMQLVERYTFEHEKFLMMSSDNPEALMERTLIGLGFKKADFDRPTSEFSGGWRMRIELAKLLLQRPDVLLLDEPTNHLDIESIQWLERFLCQSPSAVIIVSHDRAFINNVCNRTLEISCGHIIDYKVKYDEYVQLRRERREQQLRAYENQQREISEMRQFIERFRYQATKAVQVQQKIRQLEKIEPIEVDEVDNSSLHLRFPPCSRSGDYPVICDDVRKAYPLHGAGAPSDKPPVSDGSTDELLVFQHVNLTIKRGEKVAFVGRNGEGKSTLVKCIMGQIPFDGTLKIGHNVQIGYFAQNQAQLLDDDLTVFDTIDRVAKGEIRLKIRDILGAFMFGGEAIDKKVKVLSGGERSRLAMIRLLLEPVNMLILDEPTNHLDMASKDVLKAAIKAYDGTAIIVSHDREFLDGLVDKVYSFADGRVSEHIGGIYDYLSNFSQTDAAASLKPAAHAEVSKANDRQKSADRPSAAAKFSASRALHNQIRKKEKELEASENKISDLEQDIKQLDEKLYEPENASNMELVNKYMGLKDLLDAEMKHWEQLSEEIEQLYEENN